MDVRQAWSAIGDGKVIIKGSNYAGPQHRHFAAYQGRPVTVLEIGVAWGGSLQMWRAYFGEQATIVGVDIDPKCKAHAGDRMHVEIGDQADPEFLAWLDDRWGPFDVVMDDGGHTMAQQITTFEVVFPRLRDGGIYQCEDANASYLIDRYPEFGPRFSEHGTFIDAVKAKIDELNAWPPAGTPTGFTRTCTGMHFYPGLVFVEKGVVPEPTFVLGNGTETRAVSLDEITGG